MTQPNVAHLGDWQGQVVDIQMIEEGLVSVETDIGGEFYCSKTDFELGFWADDVFVTYDHDDCAIEEGCKPCLYGMSKDMHLLAHTLLN